MTWNYRIIRHTELETWFGLHNQARCVQAAARKLKGC
jgi:hypothetical protein